MQVTKSYNGRTFKESEYYDCLERYLVGLSSNKIWAYTVDKSKEIDVEETGKEEKIILRIVRWAARNDKTNKQIKFWMQRSAYNIRSSEEWFNSSEIVTNLIDENMQNPKFIVIEDQAKPEINKEIQHYKELQEKIKKLRDQKSAGKAQLNIFKKRFNLIKSNIKDYEDTLQSFKKIIDSDKSTETDVHNFMFKNNTYWFFGLEYIEIESKVKFPPGKNFFEFDLMLKRHDNFQDLIELKGPNETLFDMRTKRRNKPNVKLSEAIGQVFTYLHSCETKYYKNLLKPKAIIVIGKDKTDKNTERRIFASYLNNVELITYSELYKRGKKLLEYIKTSSSC